jgi:hypothetical protein
MSWFRTGQKCGGVKPVTRKESNPPLLITGFPTANDEKPAQIRYQSKRSHTTTMIGDMQKWGKKH